MKNLLVCYIVAPLVIVLSVLACILIIYGAWAGYFG